MSLSHKKIILISGAAILLELAGYYALDHYHKETTDDATIEAHVIPISPKLSGYVKQLDVKDNEWVSQGEILLEIDAADYRNALNQAKAVLEAARAHYEAASQSFKTTKTGAISGSESARQQVIAAQANWVRAEADLKRVKFMQKNQAASQQQLDSAIATEAATRSDLADARARMRTADTAPATVAAAESSLHELEAAVHQAEAEVAEAQQRVSDTIITAPSNGKITKRSIERGAYVEPGQQLFSIVVPDYWVVANFKETQIKHMKPGQKTTLHIEAYPHHVFSGTVDSIQSGTGARFSAFPPENATGNFVKIVQRVPVKIRFDENPNVALLLGPGMSVTPTVSVDE